MFGWGAHTEGQLGLGGIDSPTEQPLALTFFNNTSKQLVAAACGFNHSLFLLDDGSVYTCGSNEYGQLGHEKSQRVPEQVSALETQSVVGAVCGGDHNLVITDKGQVFSWGKDDKGQCGRGGNDEQFKPTPRILKSFKTVIVSVAAGSHHSLALTQEGHLFSFGDNSYGQLGLGDRKITHRTTPEKIGCLDGVPLTSVHAGGFHSFAISKSGAVFGWGKNTFGQLGVCDTTDRWYPTLVKALRLQKVKAIACGEDHTVVLTSEGGVFTFGHGQFGQLGHNSTNNEINPKKVFELMGRRVTQIAAGRRHTIAYDQACGHILAFGLGANGQLGYISTASRTGPGANQLLPVTVQGPFISYDKAKEAVGLSSSDLDALKARDMVVYQIFAGGNHSFAQAYSVFAKPQRLMSAYSAWRHKNVLALSDKMDVDHNSAIAIAASKTDGFDFFEPVDHRFLPNYQHPSLLVLSVASLKDIFSSTQPHVIKDYLTTIFSNPSCLNGSFLTAEDAHYGCSSKNPGVDMEAAREGFRYFSEHLNATLDSTLLYCLEKLLKGAGADPPDVEALRLYLILPELPHFSDSKLHANLHIPFAAAVTGLNKNAGKVIDRWWSCYGASYYERVVVEFKRVLGLLLQQFTDEKVENSKTFLRAEMMVVLQLLNKLHEVNKTHQLVSHDKFYVSEVSDHWDIQTDYLAWYQNSANSGASSSIPLANVPAPLFCEYPFVFDAAGKTRILQTDAMMQMQAAYDDAQRRNIFSVFLGTGNVDQVSPMLVLYVTRENIVTETLNQLHKQANVDYKKPMKVIFVGEEAVDAGGVRKEFFMLLLRELMDAKFGMFKHYEESRAIWFDPHTFEDEPMFYMIGIVCGLAIYNFTIVDLNFPLVLYKRLLDEECELSLEDVKDLDPTLARSLQALLDYDGDPDEFEDTFCLTFDICEHVFGEEKSSELKPGGRDIAVTFGNREEYVDLYVKHLLKTSITSQFGPFKDGFLKVCGSKVLQLFQPRELMAMVVGNQDYDWYELEKNANYKGDFSADHPTIRIFWKVFHELSLEAKKKFLLFLTGSDRIPIMGMRALHLVIQSTSGGEEYFPVAHTCFNLLDLPVYTSEEVLKDKLNAAIEHNVGFSLV